MSIERIKFKAVSIENLHETENKFFVGFVIALNGFRKYIRTHKKQYLKHNQEKKLCCKRCKSYIKTKSDIYHDAAEKHRNKRFLNEFEDTSFDVNAGSTFLVVF